MVKVIHPCQELFRGPWLLDHKALEGLDKVIDEQWKQLEARKKHQIENSIRRNREEMRKSDWYNALSAERQKEEDQKIKQAAESDPLYADDGCTVTLTLKTGVKVVESRFSSLSAAPQCQDQIVAKAEVRLICGGVKVELIVPTAPTASTRESLHPLTLVTLPGDSEPAQEAFIKFRMWANEHRPDVLRALNGTHPIGIFMLAFVSAALLSILMIVTSTHNPSPSWREDARELVKKGVTPEDHGRALQVLLRKELELSGAIVTIPIWYILSLIGIIIIALLLCIQATTAFDIGKGKASVRWQQSYDSFLRKIIPGFVLAVVTGVLANLVFEFLRSR